MVASDSEGEFQPTIIKVGSKVIECRGVGSIVDEVCFVCQELGHHVILVTSGAILMGRKRLQLEGDDEFTRRVLAAVGQPLLMEQYVDSFRKHSMVCAQGLIVRSALHSKRLQGMLQVLNLFLRHGVWVVNTNDFQSSEEVFKDNDHLASILAILAQAKLLVSLTCEEGLLTAPCGHPSSNIVKVWNPSLQIQFGDKTDEGQGGMMSKVQHGVTAAKAGVPCIVCDGRVEGNLILACKGEEVGTLFPPSE